LPDAPTLVLAGSFQAPAPDGEPSKLSTTPDGAASGSGRDSDEGPRRRLPSTLRLEVIEPSPFDEDPAAPDSSADAAPVDDTAPLAQADVSTPLPFARAERTVALVPRAPEETVAVEVATGVVKPLSAAFGPLPRLSLEEHARLYAELTRTPEQTAQILERYRLTPDQRKAEDAFWQAEFTRDPSKRAAWHRACAAARTERPTNQEPT